MDWNKLVLQAQSEDPVYPDSFKIRLDSIARRVRAILAGQHGGDLPEAPENLVGTSTEPLTVDLAWDAVPTAENYIIYSGTVGQVPSVIAQTGSTTYRALAQEPGEREYSVSAQNTVGEGPRSATVVVDVDSGDPGTLDPPDALTGWTADPEQPITDGVTLEWDAFTGTTTSIRIERKTLLNNVYTTIASGVVGTSYVDTTNLVVGNVYEYRAFPVNNAGFEGTPTANVTVSILSEPDTEAPPVPEMLVADGFGTATVAPYIRAVCEQVVAPDLAGYQFGISDQLDVNTAEWSETFTGPIGTLNQFGGSDLLSGQQYYVWARSVDQTLPPNVSEASSSPNSETIVLTIEITGDALPRTPTNPLIESTAIGSATVSWTVSGGISTGFEIWRKDSPEGPYVLAGTALKEDREFTQTGLDSNVKYTYKVRALGFDGKVSAYSNEVALYPAGQNATGGGFGQGGGPYNGEVAFGSDYVAYGTTFDYVEDLRDFTNLGRNAVVESLDRLKVRATEHPAGHPRHVALAERGSDPTRIAILLPDRTETVPMNVGRAGLAGANNHVTNWLVDSAVEFHFVASSPVAPGGRTADAEAIRDNGAAETFGYAYAPSGTADGGMLDLTLERGDTAIHLWGWDIAHSTNSNTLLVGRPIAQATSNPGLISGLNDFYLHMTRVRRGVGQNTGQNGLVLSNTRLHLEGVYMDLPNIQGHGFVLDCAPKGDMSWDKVNIHRVGGSFAVLLDTGATQGLFEPTDVGSVFITDWVCPDAWGSRFNLASGALFRHFGLHQKLEFSNCDILSTRATGATRSSWNNFDVLAENISDGSTTGSCPIVSVSHKVTAGQQIIQLPSGYTTEGISVDNCRFFSESPRIAMITVNGAPTVDLTDNVILENAPVGLQIASGGSGVSPRLFDEFNMSGNNVAGDITAFETAYGLTATQVPDVIVGRNDVNLGASTEDQAWVNFTGPDWNPPADPPDAATPIDAIGMYDAGLTRAQAKLVKRPAMVANREPKTQTGQSVALRSWAYKPGDPAANAGDYEIYFGSHLSGPPTHPFVTWSPDYSEFLMENVELFTNGVDRGYTGHYPRRKDDPTFPTSTSNQHPLVPNGEERVFAKEFHDRWGTPTGNKWTMRNCSIYDAAYPKKSSGDGVDRTKWLVRAYDYEDVLIEDCDFEYCHIEHANYINTSGSVEWKNCSWRYIGGQGVQLAHRCDDWGKTISDPYGAENAQYLSTGHTRKFDNCHFIDVSNWSYSGSNKSSNINLYSSGYPDNPCELVLFKDSTWVQGMTVAEGIQERIEAGDPEGGNYMYRSGQNVSGVSLVACLIEDQGGGSQNGEFAEGTAGSPISTEIFKTPFADVAAARDDNAATIHKVIYFKNCYLSQMDARNPMIRIDSATTVIFEDCVLIHEEVYGTTQRMFSFDSGLNAYCEPGSYNYMEDGGLHTTHNVIFRNCRVEMREVTESGTVTSVSPASMAWVDPLSGSKSFIGVGNSENQELHFTGFQNGQTPQLAYQGPIDPSRPGYIAPPAI